MKKKQREEQQKKYSQMIPESDEFRKSVDAIEKYTEDLDERAGVRPSGEITASEEDAKKLGAYLDYVRDARSSAPTSDDTGNK